MGLANPNPNLGGSLGGLRHVRSDHTPPAPRPLRPAPTRPVGVRAARGRVRVRRRAERCPARERAGRAGAAARTARTAQGGAWRAPGPVPMLPGRPPSAQRAASPEGWQAPGHRHSSGRRGHRRGRRGRRGGRGGRRGSRRGERGCRRDGKRSGWRGRGRGGSARGASDKVLGAKGVRRVVDDDGDGRVDSDVLRPARAAGAGSGRAQRAGKRRGACMRAGRNQDLGDDAVVDRLVIDGRLVRLDLGHTSPALRLSPSLSFHFGRLRTSSLVTAMA